MNVEMSLGHLSPCHLHQVRINCIWVKGKRVLEIYYTRRFLCLSCGDPLFYFSYYIRIGEYMNEKHLYLSVIFSPLKEVEIRLLLLHPDQHFCSLSCFNPFHVWVNVVSEWVVTLLFLSLPSLFTLKFSKGDRCDRRPSVSDLRGVGCWKKAATPWRHQASLVNEVRDWLVCLCIVSDAGVACGSSQAVVPFLISLSLLLSFLAWYCHHNIYCTIVLKKESFM